MLTFVSYVHLLTCACLQTSSGTVTLRLQKVRPWLPRPSKMDAEFNVTVVGTHTRRSLRRSSLPPAATIVEVIRPVTNTSVAPSQVASPPASVPMHSIPAAPLQTWGKAVQPIQLPMKAQTLLQGQATCFDFIMYDDTRAAEYLAKDPDEHIILTGPSTAENPMGSGAVCFTRKRLQNLRSELTAVFHPCQGSSGISRRHKLIKVALGSFTVYIPDADVEAACRNTKFKVFQTRASTTTVERMAPAEFVRSNNGFSTDHCQEGTQKVVHRLHPVQFVASN
jgi:hypothetical protein